MIAAYNKFPIDCFYGNLIIPFNLVLNCALCEKYCLIKYLFDQHFEYHLPYIFDDYINWCSQSSF